MKNKIFTLLALTVSFTISSQIQVDAYSSDNEFLNTKKYNYQVDYKINSNRDSIIEFSTKNGGENVAYYISSFKVYEEYVSYLARVYNMDCVLSFYKSEKIVVLDFFELGKVLSSGDGLSYSQEIINE